MRLLVFRLALFAVILTSCTTGRTAAPAPTATPIITPTTTPMPIPTPGSLSEQLGFSDNIILNIQGKNTDCGVIQHRTIQFRENRYTAYVIECQIMSYLLVYASGVQDADTTHRLILDNCDVFIRIENWQDVDGDGLPDLVVGAGNLYHYRTYVFLMTDEGRMENLLEACPFNVPGMSFPSFSDIDENGTLELVATDIRWDYDTTDIGFHEPSVFRVFTLQDCEYQDVSASYPRLYEHVINVFIRNYDYIHSGGTPRRNTVFSAFDGLFACDIVGRRDECWPLFWEMTDLERHPLDTMQPGPLPWPTLDASDLEFIEWLYEKRVILERQYEAGLPFSPGVP